MIVKKQHADGYFIYWDDEAKGDCRLEVSEQIDAMAWLKEFYPDARKVTFHVPNESDSKPQHRASPILLLMLLMDTQEYLLKPLTKVQ